MPSKPGANFSTRPTREPIVIDITPEHVAQAQATAEQQRADTGQMLDQALDVREDNIEMLRMMEGQIQQGSNDLDDIAELLARDRERIAAIDAKVKAMDSQVARGRRELVAIIRNMCRDRCFTFLIIFALVAVSIVGAIFIRDSIREANQKEGDTVVVQPAAPAPAPSTRARR